MVVPGRFRRRPDRGGWAAMGGRRLARRPRPAAPRQTGVGPADRDVARGPLARRHWQAAAAAAIAVGRTTSRGDRRVRPARAVATAASVPDPARLPAA